MPKNILIFSDGTGQAGGLASGREPLQHLQALPGDALRSGHSDRPAGQLAFYDAGPRFAAAGRRVFVTRAYRWLHNVASQATGLGITTNIIDCYAAIIRMWEPGDRIFLFGFSRGAYTVRCLAAVLALCGVPTTMADGSPLRRDVGTTTRIAREAVKKVYQHVSSPAEGYRYLPSAKALATRFRQQYSSTSPVRLMPSVLHRGVRHGRLPGSYRLSAAMVAGAAAFLSLPSWVLSVVALTFWTRSLLLSVFAGAVAVIWYVVSHLRYATGLEGYTFWETLHFTAPKMKFYDPHLDNEVRYARQALSLDENRKDFAIVKWGSKSNKGPPRTDSDPDWLQ